MHSARIKLEENETQNIVKYYEEKFFFNDEEKKLSEKLRMQYWKQRAENTF